MEKKLFKKLSLNFALIGGIFIVVFFLILYGKSKIESYQRLEDILNQVSTRYDLKVKEIEGKVALYQKDYLNRAQAVDFILKNNIDMRNAEGLQEIKRLMGVESIYVIGHSGEILLSTKEETLGLNLLEYEEAKTFWGLITGSDSKDYAIDLEATNIIEDIPKSYIGVKSSVDDYAIIQIGMQKSEDNTLDKKDTMVELLRSTPTVYERFVCAIDEITGELLGITVNNEQSVVFNNIHSKEELIDLLKQSNKMGLTKINGKYYFFKARYIDQMFLVSGEDTSIILDTLLLQVVYQASIISVISLALLYGLKKYFRYYIINDLVMMESTVKEVVTGNFKVDFKAQNEGFYPLVGTLNDWKDSYKNKSDRMTQIVTDIGSRIAVFECLYYIQSNFFTDNMQSILELEDREWNRIKSKPEDFEKYIRGLVGLGNEDGIVCMRDKCIQIKFHSVNQEFYGMIVDKTIEIKNQEQTANALKKAREDAEKDYLTKLLNRKGFEKRVRYSLEEIGHEGIMFIFDLDNFKRINDSLGHPEGDKVLGLIGTFLRSEFRQEDIIGRLGGDEFVVFIQRNIPIEVLTKKLDKMLEDARQRLAHYNEYNVSISIGVTYVTSEQMGYKDVYKSADIALYKAKQLGKDRYYIND